MLEVREVSFRYEDMMMDFSLRVGAGECLAVIGPSGAGKSTLLSLIAGFDRPSAGRIVIDGQDVTALPPSRRPVSTVFQEHNLFPHLNVTANVGLGIDPGLRLSVEDRDRMADALRQVGLEGLEARLPAQLSGGERQRVALARALVRHQPLLLLDEPFAALGPALRSDMLALLDELRISRDLTLLMVSHHPADARSIAANTAFVHQGQILALGPTGDLLNNSDLPQLRAYLGDAPS